MADVNFTSFNLHGFNNSESYLRELLNSNDIVFIQEHWQCSRNFGRLASLSANHDFVATDSMEHAAGKGMLRGRPYGGIACFWSKSLSSFIKPIHVPNNPRVLALRICCESRCVLLFNVYMPYLNAACRLESQDEFFDFLSCMETVMEEYPGCEIIVAGDLNFQPGTQSPFETIYDDFCSKHEMRIIDDLFDDNATYTFFNTARNVYKWLDHFTVTDSFVNSIDKCRVESDACNLSDHLPICCKLKLNLVLFPPPEPQTSYRKGKVVWEKLNDECLSQFRDCLDAGLDCIPIPNAIYCQNPHCDDKSHHLEIDRFHNSIMESILSADRVLPRVKPGVQKVWWSHELSEAKRRCVDAHNLWKDSGSPRHGPTFMEKQSAKLSYKRLLRNSKGKVSSDKFDNMSYSLLSKDQGRFWRDWKTLNGCKQSPPSSIAGYCDAQTIAVNFMEHFKKVSQPNNVPRCNEMKEMFLLDLSESLNNHECNCMHHRVGFNQVIDAVMNLKTGKASNCGLQSEHFLNGTVKLFSALRLCFNMFLSHGFVPNQYQMGTIIPLVKDTQGDLTSMDNYRGITLGSVSSKIFEGVLLALFGEYLYTDPCQFGFKKRSGTVDALYVFRQTVEYYNNQGSNVFMCFIDSSKAFDKVVHCGLFHKLLKRGAPLPFIRVLMHWYGGLTCVVKWGDALSPKYQICAGVRQGGVLSPLLYCVYIDDLATQLRTLQVGCYMMGLFYGLIIYADDIALLAPSRAALQQMMDICSKYGLEWDISFNPKKSQAMLVGPKYKMVPAPLNLSNGKVSWVDSFKYLGVVVKSYKSFQCDITATVSKFYRCLNSLLRFRCRPSDVVQIHLLMAHAAPILTYAIEVIKIDTESCQLMSVAFNSIFRKVMHYRRNESVSEIRNFFGYDDFSTLITKRRDGFLRRLKKSNSPLIEPLLAAGMNAPS